LAYIQFLHLVYGFINLGIEVLNFQRNLRNTLFCFGKRFLLRRQFIINLFWAVFYRWFLQVARLEHIMFVIIWLIFEFALIVGIRGR